MRATRRRGFALLVVLWAMSVAAIAGMGAVLAGRDSYNVARNRLEAERAYWRAAGCMSIAHATIDDALANASSLVARTRAWRALDTLVSVAPADSLACRLSLMAAGDRVDVNAASEEMLRRMFTGIVGPTAAIPLTDALLDWRDSDEDVRATGAEADWYIAQKRHQPRNGALMSIDELRRVRGFEQLDGLESVLSVEPGRISIATAPFRVLALVPGLTDETLVRLAEYRAEGRQVDDLLALHAALPRAAAGSLMIRYSDIVQLTTLDPDAWIVTVVATSGRPAISVTAEARLVRKGSGSALVRYRSRS